MLSDSAILKHIARQSKRQAGYKQLVRELGLHGEERRQLNDHLHKLVKSGALIPVDSDRYALPQAAADKNLVAGRLTMHRDGFGFVIPDAKSLSPALKSKLAGDIFIPPHQIGNAMHGDLVLVDIQNVRPDGRAEGRIVRPVNRAHPTVVGTFHYNSRRNYVTPIDTKITQEIVIPEGMEFPESSVPPVSSVVNDSESSPQRPQRTRRKNKSVDRVLGEEAARHADWSNLEGVVVPPAVLEEAQGVPATIPSSELHRRRDFRELPIVTIDGETARDFDDAVLVRQLPNNNYELHVHIADVAHYVTRDSALDQEARLRGTSVYFPDRAVPMLPLELSTDICSLRPQVERLVLSCTMEIDHRGEIVGYELCEGIIRSAERMTYTDVNAVLEGDQPLRKRYAPLVSTFELMRDLAQILNRKRERRGSIDFDLPEPVIEFDEFGLMKSITRSERNFAHRLIEEFMLSANETVAHHLESHRVASLYRIHEKPDAKRVYDFETIAATFGYSLGVGALPIQRVQMKADRRAAYGTGKRVRDLEIPKEVHITPRMYQKLTEKIAGKPEERILSYLMLRSLKQARYSEENLGHFALAAPTYTHFTSPIRRYPDLIVHRILKEQLSSAAKAMGGAVEERPFRAASGVVKKEVASATVEDAPSPWSKRRDHAAHRQSQAPLRGPISLEELHEIADESSQSERRADEAERELMEWKKAKFMQDRVGEDFDGLITSVTKFGFFVELTELFVEGLVPLNTLIDDRYTYRENTREIIGQHSRKTYRIGDRLRVLVDRIDPVEKKINFAVLEEEPKPRRGKRRKK
ncbi:MAG: ribonuclease R [Acidobacteria bacterium 13_1_20CM_4_56_7]|nr:MAG: ribonuclease R [Acidobacteria bacterium 13_1_20CM_4_56_7]